MIIFRLCKAAFAKDLSGKGAELSGGRWNSKGTAMLYASSSRALCMAEVAFHLPLYLVPEDYRLISLEIPERLKFETVFPESLSTDWKQFPHKNSTQLIGDAFIKSGKNLLIRVPSAVVQGEWNYLINTNHKDVKLIKTLSNDPFHFDERLLGNK